jgi:hypothetical protein
MRDILLDTMHGPSKQHLIFIVQRNDDEHLCLPWLFIQDLTKRKLFLFKVAWIAGGCSISHMGEFTVFLVGKGIEETRRDGTVEDEIALEEVDPFHGLESSRLTRGRFTTSDIGAFIHVGTRVWSVAIIHDVWVLEIRWTLLRVVVIAIQG